MGQSSECGGEGGAPMNRYRMYLIMGSLELPLQVLPEKLAVRAAGRNETAEVLELGEVLLLRGRGLRKVEWEGLLPAWKLPCMDGQPLTPILAVRYIQRYRDKKEPVYLRLEGTDLDLDVPFGIEDFSYEERGGEPGDLYYSIQLTEWRSYAPSRVTLPEGEVREARQRTPGAAAIRWSRGTACGPSPGGFTETGPSGGSSTKPTGPWWGPTPISSIRGRC